MDTDTCGEHHAETGTQTQREDGQVKVEAETGDAATARRAWTTGSCKRQGRSLLNRLWRERGWPPPDLRPLASRSGREYTFVVTSYSVWDIASQETNPVFRAQKESVWPGGE